MSRSLETSNTLLTIATTRSGCNVCDASVDVNTIPEILDAIAVAREGLEKANDLQLKGTSIAKFLSPIDYIEFM